MGTDLRLVRCKCEKSECKTGIRFDGNEDESNRYLLFTDKNGNDHSMVMNEESKKELIKALLDEEFELQDDANDINSDVSKDS